MFIHLHNHTVFSPLDGLQRPMEVARRASELDMKAVAITDHGSITGHIEFAKACYDFGIKPILGVEAYFCNSAVEKNKEDQLYHIVLLAKNKDGWSQLCRLMTDAHKHFYKKPRVDLDMLRSCRDIICLTGCMRGLFSHPHYEKLITSLYVIFGDDLYYEIMPIDMEEQKLVNERAVACSKLHSVPLVVTNDCHYVYESDSDNHSFLLSMNTGGKLSFDVTGLHFRSQAEMVFACDNTLPYIDRTIWKDAISITESIADKVEVFLEKQPIVLPKMSEDPQSDLEKIAHTKLNEYCLFIQDIDLQLKYQDRLKYELQVVKQKEFANYFLFVADIVDNARKNKIGVGRSRGSAGGSLLSFVLGITNVDSIEYDLLFERFLNPERTDMPDIDIDFQQSRRNEVFEYVRKTYGHDRVANINTLAELKPRMALKDVSKYFGVPHDVVNSITTKFRDLSTLTEEMEDPEIKAEILKLPDSDKLIKYTNGIVGILRQEGTHAGGIVVSPNNLYDNSVMMDWKDGIRINWRMSDCEYLGFVKVDLLALRTLDVIQTSLELIKERHGVEVDFDDCDIEGEDNTVEFGLGHTVGMFQFEKPLLTQLCKDLSPTLSLDTLVHVNSLARPGPLDSGMTKKYVTRYRMLAKGKQYMSPSEPYYPYIKHIVSSTLDVIIYQEQVMKIAVDVAGYTVGESDILRKVIAKSKGASEFSKHKDKFVKGCVSVSGMEEKHANRLFDDLSKYSRYVFNKSHAVGYTLMALSQMWLKRHYPLEYLASLYTWTPEVEKRYRFLDEAKRLNIEVLPPDINKSGFGVSIYRNSIVAGLDSIKGIGPKAVESIIESRGYKPFDSLQGFRTRVPRNKVNKRTLEYLIKAGCFSELHVNQKVAVDNIDWFAEYFDFMVGKKKTISFVSLPGLYDPEGDYSTTEKEKSKIQSLEGIYRIDVMPTWGLQSMDGLLEQLRQDILKCRDCELWDNYKTPVPFEHTNSSGLFIIGEAPGEEENKKGQPFVGKAGKLLDSEFKNIGVTRDMLHISNVFKCRPKNNVLPITPPKECYKHLVEEIRLLAPGLIMAFGNTPLMFLRNQKGGIQSLNGSITTEIVGDRMIPVLWCIHPASTFRQGGEENKKRLMEAFKKLHDVIKEL